MSVTLTVSEIFDVFLKNCIAIFKILYLGYFLGFSNQKKLKIFALNCSLFLILSKMFVTLTVSEIFDVFFKNCIAILKILYLGYFWDFSNQKKLKIFVLDCCLFLLSYKISVTLTVFKIIHFFNFFFFNFSKIF